MLLIGYTSFLMGSFYQTVGTQNCKTPHTITFWEVTSVFTGILSLICLAYQAGVEKEQNKK